MKTVKYVIALISLAVMFGCSEQRAEKALNERIVGMVTAIEANDMRTVVENYVDPTSVLILKSKGNYESEINSMKDIDPSNRARCIAELKSCLNIRPIFSDNYNKAVFKHKEFSQDFVFKKVNGNWYFAEE